MFSFLSKFFISEGIDLFAPIPISECNVRKPYLLNRAGISDGTAILFAIPYLTPMATTNNRNLSLYAVSRDYHLFVKELFERLLPLLREHYPENRFAAFADHSPIDEVEAAARAGLGCIGCNRLLITQKYASFIFLGEIVTDAKLPCTLHEISHCESCGKCIDVCPAKKGRPCLSALTQKKGELTPDEQTYLLEYGSVWGCDLCQEVCPHAQKAISEQTAYTSIPFFSEKTISHLTSETLNQMTDSEFSERAYSWRGRQPVLRNLLLTESDCDSRKSKN
jgi:epoxyqueuosine reductase